MILENSNEQKLEYLAGRILLSDYNHRFSKPISNQKELRQAEYDLIATCLD